MAKLSSRCPVQRRRRERDRRAVLLRRQEVRRKPFGIEYRRAVEFGTEPQRA